MAPQTADRILRDTYLLRPPFRFLHDVVMDIFAEAAPWGAELYSGDEKKIEVGKEQAGKDIMVK